MKTTGILRLIVVSQVAHPFRSMECMRQLNE